MRGRADDIELWNTYLALVERQGTLLQVSRVKERASQALALTQSKQRAGYRLSRAPDFQQALAELGAKLGERLVALVLAELGAALERREIVVLLAYLTSSGRRVCM